MRLTIAAIGKIKNSPEAELYQEYAKRLPWKLALKEVNSNAALAEAVEGSERIIALDERGKQMTSREFANLLKTWQDDGVASVGFVIGGADGLTPELRKSAYQLLALGTMTWPHLLARAMLAEQLYRASTLISGHPYHRD